MLGMKRWVALFSQTGTELVSIYERTKIHPDKIISNGNPETYNMEVLALPCNFEASNRNPTVEEYKELLGDPRDTVVTLHGWLRIIPPAICQEYEIYNGHPALINRYEELKGKDQQESVAGRAAAYPHIGSVIHSVTPELDGGPILTSCSTRNTTATVEDAYTLLRKTSLKTWEVFLKHYDTYNEPAMLPPEVLI